MKVIIKPREINNLKFYILGAVILALNCLRHRLFGYRTPRDFSAMDVDRAIEYDIRVAGGWLRSLKNYTGSEDILKDKAVLELGPGPDLGTGVILLALGAKKYTALDIHRLADSAGIDFYKKLLSRVKSEYPDAVTGSAYNEIEKFIAGKDSSIRYIVSKSFDLNEVKGPVDIVFGQASFEHFDNVEKIFAGLNRISAKGALLASEVDLMTHTRWIREEDPLNIYRYPDIFYNITGFRGSPNRLRSCEYKKTLELTGWTDIKIIPLKILDDEYYKNVEKSIRKRFRSFGPDEMRILSFILCAKKA